MANRTKDERIHDFVLLLTGASFALLVFTSGLLEPRVVARLQQPSPSLEVKIKSLNEDLFAKHKEYQKAKANEKSQALSRLADVAKKRKEKMLVLIEEDPQQALQLAISSEIRKTLPKEIQENIEEEVALSGELEVLVEDDFVNNKAKYFYFLVVGKEKFSLHPTQDLPPLISGSKVKVSGLRLEQKIAFDLENTLEVLEEAVPESIGDQKTAIILVNFPSDPSEPLSVAQARDVVFTSPQSANAFYQEVSYGKTSLSGDVFGWYTLPAEVTCDTFSDLYNPVLEAADLDIYFPDYKRLVIAFVDTDSCNFGAGVGGIGTVGSWEFTTADGDFRASMAAIKSQWFNLGSETSLMVVRHELGHNFGVHHANAYDCGFVTIDSVFVDCTSHPYADPFDTMGNIKPAHLHAYHKDLIGWLDSAEVVELSTVGTQTVTLVPLEQNTPGVKAVKIPRGINNDIEGGERLVGGWHYVEYRRRVGFDASLDFRVEQGALLSYSKYIFGTGGDTHLLDTTPESRGSEVDDRLDSALRVEQTFSDISKGISITTVDKTDEQLTIDVTLDQPLCYRLLPTIVVTPPSHSVPPGQQVAYEISLTSNDAAGCSPRTFSFGNWSSDEADIVRASDFEPAPGTWTQAFSPPEVTLSPGEEASNTLTLTPGVDVPDDSYQVEVLIGRNLRDLGCSSVCAHWIDMGLTIDSSLATDTEAPSVSITSPIDGQEVVGTLEINANATDNVEVSQVEFFIDIDTDPNTKFTDNSAPYEFNWDTTTVAYGLHKITAKAYDLATPTPNVGEASINVTVNNDTDGDGCNDGQELGADETLGGRRDLNNPYDFFDTPLPAGDPGTGSKNKVINIFDVLGALTKFYTDDNGTPDDFTDDVPSENGQKYNPDFDRTFKGPNAWNLGPPDGRINIFDVLRILAQFGHSCI